MADVHFIINPNNRTNYPTPIVDSPVDFNPHEASYSFVFDDASAEGYPVQISFLKYNGVSKQFNVDGVAGIFNLDPFISQGYPIPAALLRNGGAVKQFDPNGVYGLFELSPVISPGMGYPTPRGISCIIPGAFKNCINLQSIDIPRSVKHLGRYTFSNTSLKEVTISRDCEYYSTTFPMGCVIHFYDEE